ncbi:Omp28-related outer membrane protein [Tenuifilum thalassicum]|uniref:Omp28-related outer membrane protein n=1 Tax=Tenuifilum thalassicum TaxID=2590900 RepID=A0A7D3XG25_9BACT|nr:Omp28-related outer membrane protein [Tenuifilum thalassicum]QKG79837.1 Omp28-related outer membrane protein [Tenuifilum thalassicum]
MRTLKSKLSTCLLVISLISTSMVGCKKTDTSAPVVTSSIDYVNLTDSSVLCKGTIVDNGGAQIIEKGFVWSLTENPTVDDNQGIVTLKSESNDFEAKITGLMEKTSYYVRAFAKNSVGIGYSQQVKFTTTEKPWEPKHVTNILIEDYTATWCGYCPRIHYAIKDVTSQNENIHALAIYQDSDKKFQYFNQLASTFGVEGFPTAIVNRKATWDYPETLLSLSSYLNSRSPLGISIETSYNNTTASIIVKVEYAKNIEDPLKLVVCLTESKLIGEQANYYDDGNGNPIKDFEHNHVLRRVITELLGNDISTQETLKDNISTFTFNDISLESYNPANCEVIAFVTKANDKSVINVQGVKLGEIKDFQYLAK